ncbi:MAG: redoxin domain-containing protein [Bacteroidales bacterium]
MRTLFLFTVAFLSTAWTAAQTASLPDVALRNIDGKIVSSREVLDNDRATLLVFWKTTNGKCCDNLELMQEAWVSHLKGHDIKLVAICVDCHGSWSHVKPIVMGNAWEFDTYIDVNGDFMRALSVGDAPCTMIFDSNLEMICRYNGACSGTSEFICMNILDHLGLSTDNPPDQ